MSNKSNTNPTVPYALPFLGNPAPQYVPLADVSFGSMQVVMPHALPPQSMAFPTPWFNKMLNIPSPNVVYDGKRNGIAF